MATYAVLSWIDQALHGRRPKQIDSRASGLEQVPAACSRTHCCPNRRWDRMCVLIFAYLSWSFLMGSLDVGAAAPFTVRPPDLSGVNYALVAVQFPAPKNWKKIFTSKMPWLRSQPIFSNWRNYYAWLSTDNSTTFYNVGVVPLRPLHSHLPFVDHHCWSYLSNHQHHDPPSPVRRWTFDHFHQCHATLWGMLVPLQHYRILTLLSFVQYVYTPGFVLTILHSKV